MLTLSALTAVDVLVVAGNVVSTPNKVVDGPIGMIVPPSRLGSSGCDAPDAGGGTGRPVPLDAFVVVVFPCTVVGVVVAGALEVVTTAAVVVVAFNVVVVVDESEGSAAHAAPVRATKRSAPAARETVRRMRPS